METNKCDTSNPLNHALGDETKGDNGEARDSDARVRYVVSKLEDGHRKEKIGKRPTTPTPEEPSNIAVVVKEYWDDESKEKKTELVLKGQDLRDIIGDVLSKQFEHDERKDWKTKEQIFDESILCYWDELSEAAKSYKSNEQGREDLQLLLKHVRLLKFGRVELMESIQTITKILPDDLGYLFRPGDLVVSKPYLDELQLFRISEANWLDKGTYEEFEVVAWAFDWTGTELTQKYYAFKTRPEKRDNKEIDIVDLPCYPIRYHKNSEGVSGDGQTKSLSDVLSTRGETFRKLCKESAQGKQYTYNAELLSAPRSSRSITADGIGADEFSQALGRPYPAEQKKRTVKDDIMIDFTAYKRYGPSTGAVGNLSPINYMVCKCRLCFGEGSTCDQWLRHFATEDGSNDSADETKNSLLLPARVLGYCLHDKTWAQFHVTKVEDVLIPSSDEYSNKLVFPEDSESAKQDLKILIEQHGQPNPHMIGDPIAGKGCGLVVLLHGPPGVGKTLTAETLAKSSGKPLYVVGASDIGLDPRLAEATLAHIFELAERWGAVLLIDEADVFLDSRGSKGEADVAKNALVSVMLRVLEYFKGILIMTTNRVMMFDVAMLSRCHYAIDFKSLTQKQEKKIWQSYVDQLNQNNCGNKGHIEEWVAQTTRKRTKLNGREIRNVFTTAQTLAMAEPNKKMTRKHLEHVYERLTEFLDAMNETKIHAQSSLNTNAPAG